MTAPSVTACYEASVVTSKFDVARACIAQDPYEVYPVPESCQAVCNVSTWVQSATEPDIQDAFYNDMVANAWQCRLDSEYSPNALFRKTDATSDNYVSSLQELTALSDACEDYHMPPFVATTSLTEPPLWVSLFIAKGGLHVVARVWGGGFRTHPRFRRRTAVPSSLVCASQCRHSSSCNTPCPPPG